jgi:hypothetical protein
VAVDDRVDELHDPMAVREGGQRRPVLAAIARCAHGRVERTRQVEQGVVPALGMTGGQRAARLDRRLEQRGIADKLEVRPRALPDPHALGPLLIPGERPVRAVDVERQLVLMPRAGLRHDEAPACAAVEPQHDRAEVLGGDRDRLGLPRRRRRERLDRPDGTAPLVMEGRQVGQDLHDGRAKQVLGEV